MGRNPLKSGQCFLHSRKNDKDFQRRQVAIPSNRVNVSYRKEERNAKFKEASEAYSVLNDESTVE